MKRSNRLVLLIGIFLAIVAFIGIVLLIGQDRDGDGGSTPPTTVQVVVAKEDLVLGQVVRPEQLDVITVETSAALPGYFSEPSQAAGRPVRQRVGAGAQITSAMFTGGGDITDIDVPAGFVAMAVQVDQTTGVGTVIKPGDFVDMVVGFTADKFPVVVPPGEDAANDQFTVLTGVNGTSVKLLLQGMQVLGTLLPPAPEQQGQQQQQQDQGDGQTTLTGQQQIVILQLLPQQAEVIKFAQMDGNISLVLRSADDFFDPETGAPITFTPSATSGVILKILVDDYGVLVPELVEAILPATQNP